MASDGTSISWIWNAVRSREAAGSLRRLMTSNVLGLAGVFMVLAAFGVCESRAHDVILSGAIDEPRPGMGVGELGASWGAAVEKTDDDPPDAEGEAEKAAEIESRPLGRASSPKGAKRAAAMSEESNRSKGTNGASNEVVRVAGALAIVIGLLLGMRLLLRRLGTGICGPMGENGALEIVAKYPVARGQRLLLVRLASRIVLVHQSGSSMTALSEIAEPEDVEEILSHATGAVCEGSRQRVASLLGGFMTKRGTGPAQAGGPGARASSWPVEVVDLTQEGHRTARRVGRGGRDER